MVNDVLLRSGAFLVCLENWKLTHVVTHATRETSHSSDILGLILMSDLSSLHSLHYLRVISDHKIILSPFSFAFPEDRPTPKQIKLYGHDNYETITT